jgi:circadian clock protein KaiC
VSKVGSPSSPPSAAAGRSLPRLAKAPTGISGLDQVTEGGVPRGRPTLVCGPAGSGKTLLAMEFLIRGIIEYGEPGVFVAFEETADELTANVASLGFDLRKLEDDGLLVVDYVDVATDDVTEVGDWDLEGLFVRLGFAIDSVGAKRVAVDTIERLFDALPNSARVRTELRRLFVWLKARGVTAVITAERGDGLLTRRGIEEYVSDCVIVLDHRVTEQTSTRRLRVLKYRGSLHGTNEYPFLIGATGITVLPITSMGLEHRVSNLRMSTGVDRLDAMLGGSGVYRGSSVLVSGTAGTGKSTVAAQMCDAACQRGERALYLGFEESEAQIVRNMGSVGMDLRRWVDAGLLLFHCVRPSLLGLEAHLSAMQTLVSEFDPSVVVTDPISNLAGVGDSSDVSAMLTRQVDFLKSQGVTAIFTSLNSNPDVERGDQQIASLMDTWVLVKTLEGNGERSRLLYVLKSRGMGHSNQIREFVITNRGIELADVYVGPQGVLTGSARSAQEAKERSETNRRLEDLDQRRVNLERRRESVEAQAAILWREFEAEADAVGRLLGQEINVDEQRAEQSRLRLADVPSGAGVPDGPNGAG